MDDLKPAAREESVGDMLKLFGRCSLELTNKKYGKRSKYKPKDGLDLGIFERLAS